jgi:RNA polymerase sigma-70 factor (ECF subfamily)
MGMSDGWVEFPSTHWSQLDAVRGPLTPEHRAVLNRLIERYWKPVYQFTLRSGYDAEDAKDLVQEFFCQALQKQLFGKADRTRGRFRSFLLKSYKNFLANAMRYERAAIRWPEQGFTSIPDLARASKGSPRLAVTETPDTVFERTWVTELLGRVVRLLEEECRVTGKELHYELFRRRITEPILEGEEAPELKDLARHYGITEKQVSNRVLTARRAFQRLLRQEIRAYASTDEEVAIEVQDLFSYVKER